MRESEESLACSDLPNNGHLINIRRHEVLAVRTESQRRNMVVDERVGEWASGFDIPQVNLPVTVYILCRITLVGGGEPFSIPAEAQPANRATQAEAMLQMARFDVPQ